MPSARLLSFVSIAAALGLVAISACSSTVTSGASAEDAALPETDGGADAPIDAPRDANVRDANGAGAVDAVCSFNYDCRASLRCECSEATGCACKAGARGTGRNGLDPCTSGNDCASAVCVEGPPSTGSFCSDECGSAADCVGKLPVCQSISFVGTICIRTPPK
jgi:hypothetical protein